MKTCHWVLPMMGYTPQRYAILANISRCTLIIFYPSQRWQGFFVVAWNWSPGRTITAIQSCCKFVPPRRPVSSVGAVGIIGNAAIAFYERLQRLKRPVSRLYIRELRDR